MIWKDRIKQYAHRYTLTNVSGSTYDFTEVTGEVNEVGTPVNAENMNKLLQRDGDDIKDTVTTFSEAETRVNIATGEATKTIFGKIKKWFADLKPHAFNDLATSQGAETDKAPTNKLLNDTAALKIDKTDISTVMPLSSAAASNSKVLSEKLTYDEFEKRTIAQEYKSILSISGITTSNTLFEIFDAMVYPSRLICYPNFEGFNALLPSEAPNIYGAMTIDKQDDYRGKVEYFGHDLTTAHLPFLFFGSFNKNQNSPFTGWQQLATTDSPTFTGTVTVPAPTNPTDAARLQDVTGLAAVYDIVIKTQAQFEALIASPTWFDAVSVAFVGQFTLSTTDNSGIKIPATVKQIHGFNSAKITITNFLHNETTAKGGLWYDTAPTTQDYSIRDLEVSCTGPISLGFYGCKNLSNCTGTGTGTTFGYGFRDCNNLSNCTGTGTGTSGNGYGFTGCNNLSNCTGTGTGTYGFGFYSCNNLSNCTGTGTGTYGFGFFACDNLSNCTGTGTGTSGNGYGFSDINYAVNCKDGGSSTDMWDGTNRNIDLDTCCKTLVIASNTTLNT